MAVGRGVVSDVFLDGVLGNGGAVDIDGVRICCRYARQLGAVRQIRLPRRAQSRRSKIQKILFDIRCHIVDGVARDLAWCMGLDGAFA